MRELQRSLTAKLQDDSPGLLSVDDCLDMLHRDRLEIELVGGVVIRGNGLRIAVHHDGRQPRITNSVGGMAAGVVKLQPLTDPVGTIPKDDHSIRLGITGLVLLLKGGVEVRGVRLKLRCAGVYPLEDGFQILCPQPSSNVFLCAGEQAGQMLIWNAHLLGAVQLLPTQVREEATIKLLLHRQNRGQLGEEPTIDVGQLVDHRHVHSPTHALEHSGHPIRGSDRQCFSKLLLAPLRRFSVASFQRRDGLQEGLGEASADPHDLADRFH